MKRIVALIIVAFYFSGCSIKKDSITTQMIPVVYKDSIVYLEIECPDKTRQQIRLEEQTKRKTVEEETKRVKIESAAELKAEKENTKRAKQDAIFQVKKMAQELKELRAIQKHDERIFKQKLDSLEIINKTLQKQIVESGKTLRQESKDNRKSQQTEHKKSGKFWIGYLCGIVSLLILILAYILFIKRYLPKF